MQFKKNCLNCKKEFLIFPYEVNAVQYCSVKCRAASIHWRKKMKLIAQKLRGKKKLKKRCLNCKKIYYVHPCLKNVNKFCGRACHAQYYIGGWNKGKTKKDFPKLSNAGVKRGNIPWNKGLRENHRKTYPYVYEFQYSSLKELIRNKYQRKCQVCGCSEIECTKKLAVHHIDYNPFNLNVNNLIPLCKRCHSKTNGNYPNRKKWEKYFNERVYV